MEDVYIAVLEISGYDIIERTNKKLDSDSIHREDGLEVQVIYCDDDFFQLKIYAENIYTTRLLCQSVEYSGEIYGGKLNVPILIKTYGGFAGVLCDYIISVSHEPIYWDNIYLMLGIDRAWIPRNDNYLYLTQKLASWKRIYGFAELMNYVDREDEFIRLTNEMIESTCVYDEAFNANFYPHKCGNICFEENLTLLAAKEATKSGRRIAVLNFANPVEVGGGVLRGAMAQEENLCRSSNLYKSLSSEKAKSYYEANRMILSRNQFNSMFLGTDQVVYSPDVTVVKKNTYYQSIYIGEEEYTKDYFKVDVITAAAPFFSGSGYILPDGDLQHLLERRIKNILEVAIANGVDTLVLGAFGCGAFHNPPMVVADAFRNVLLDPRYQYAFDEVIFAVKRTAEICPNIEAFQKNFSLFPHINYQGSEKIHRQNWKWECPCGVENDWDSTSCKKCQGLRKNRKRTHCY